MKTDIESEIEYALEALDVLFKTREGLYEGTGYYSVETAERYVDAAQAEIDKAIVATARRVSFWHQRFKDRFEEKN